MPTARKNSQGACETQDKILNAAELLFIEKGFSATSLRAIASKANVNLAAAHYHFGSKEGLFAAAIHRHIEPITQRRLQALDTLLAGAEPITVENIMSALLSPLFDSNVSKSLPKLMGRIFGEPETVVGPILQEEFGSTADQFVDALQIALPDIERSELQWRFNFSVGAMIQLLNFDSPPGQEKLAGSNHADEPPQEHLEKLLSYITAGITQ